MNCISAVYGSAWRGYFAFHGRKENWKIALKKCRERRIPLKIIVTCTSPDGQKLERICFSEFQAFTTIQTLHREGCRGFGMREEA